MVYKKYKFPFTRIDVEYVPDRPRLVTTKTGHGRTWTDMDGHRTDTGRT